MLHVKYKQTYIDAKPTRVELHFGDNEGWWVITTVSPVPVKGKSMIDTYKWIYTYCSKMLEQSNGQYKEVTVDLFNRKNELMYRRCFF